MKNKLLNIGFIAAFAFVGLGSIAIGILITIAAFHLHWTLGWVMVVVDCIIAAMVVIVVTIMLAKD